MDERTVIGRGLFDKHADFEVFSGLRVRHSLSGAVGVIESRFGTSGKFKVYFSAGVGSTATAADDARLILDYKRMMFTPPDGKAKRRLIQ